MAQICPRYPRNSSLVTFFSVRVGSAGEHVDIVQCRHNLLLFFKDSIIPGYLVNVSRHH
jgi:hypothetical protein